VIEEVLKVKPELDPAAASRLEKNLNARFGRVAKKFGFGLMNVIKGSGVLGLALGFIDKLLNPLKETQDAIERMISQGDDIVTNAKQFGTTAGKLFKLTKFAQASGLDQEGVFTLLTKFQSAVAEAKADPKKQSAVRNFTEDADIAESFFSFIQALRDTTDATKRTLIQNEVFGEKQTLKYADFLQQDFKQLSARLGLASAESYTAPLNNLANKKDMLDELRSRNSAADVFLKGSAITEGMIKQISAAEAIAMQKENERIANFKNLAAISMTMDKIMGLVEQLVSMLGKLIVILTPGANELMSAIKKIGSSRLLKGYTGMKGE